MKSPIGSGILVMILATLLWGCVNLWMDKKALEGRSFEITGRNIHNAKLLCDTNQKLKLVKLGLDSHTITCHNGAHFKRPTP